MDSFDFNSLDPVALDETLSFLNDYDPTPLPDLSLAGFGGFGEPVMDWPVFENPAWVPLDNADLSGGVTNALTDNSVPGSHLPDPGWGVDFGHNQPPQVVEAETPLDFGELRFGLNVGLNKIAPDPLNGIAWQPNPFQVNNESTPSQTLAFSASRIAPSTIREPFLQGSEHDNVSAVKESSQSMDAIPLPCRTCDWPSCKSTTTYGTFRDLCNHKTDVHVAEILKSWPGSCSWPGCNSKIFFKTSKRLESHVYNIHITPLCCTATGCAHKRPFERQADLERHVASKHTNERKYKCRYPQCRYSSWFSRKDKLKLHETTYHGQFACQFSHCIYGYPSAENLQRHLSAQVNHGDYECGLGSCGRTSTSHFHKYDIHQHLQHDHKIPHEVSWQAIDKLPYGKLNKTLTSAHFPDGRSDFQDCESCIKKLKEVASGRGGSQEK